MKYSLYIQIIWIYFNIKASVLMKRFDFKRFRRDKNLTQLYVAELLSCNQNFISNIERGVKMIPSEKLDILTSIFGDISDYMAEEKQTAESKSNQADPPVSVIIPIDVWEVIKNQAESLKYKDEVARTSARQLDEVIGMLKEQLNDKKNAVVAENVAKEAALG